MIEEINDNETFEFSNVSKYILDSNKLKEDTEIQCACILKRVDKRQDTNGETFLKFIFKDCKGTIVIGRCFNNSIPFNQDWASQYNKLCFITGDVNYVFGKLSITVITIDCLTDSDSLQYKSLFFERACRECSDAKLTISSIVNGLSNKTLLSLAQTFYSSNTFNSLANESSETFPRSGTEMVLLANILQSIKSYVAIDNCLSEQDREIMIVAILIYRTYFVTAEDFPHQTALGKCYKTLVGVNSESILAKVLTIIKSFSALCQNNKIECTYCSAVLYELFISNYRMMELNALIGNQSSGSIMYQGSMKVRRD